MFNETKIQKIGLVNFTKRCYVTQQNRQTPSNYVTNRGVPGLGTAGLHGASEGQLMISPTRPSLVSMTKRPGLKGSYLPGDRNLYAAARLSS